MITSKLKRYGKLWVFGHIDRGVLSMYGAGWSFNFFKSVFLQLQPKGNVMGEPIAKGIDEKFCSECGAVIKTKAEICPKCGVRQFGQPVTINLGPVAANGKSRIAAALFAFFLGGFGGHKFYLGQIGLGILYLIFFWTFIPAIVAFIEFILLLTMSDETFNQKYGHV
jgi:TM2 domain-containing membrane protein YozV